MKLIPLEYQQRFQIKFAHLFIVKKGNEFFYRNDQDLVEIGKVDLKYFSQKSGWLVLKINEDRLDVNR